MKITIYTVIGEIEVTEKENGIEDNNPLICPAFTNFEEAKIKADELIEKTGINHVIQVSENYGIREGTKFTDLYRKKNGTWEKAEP